MSVKLAKRLVEPDYWTCPHGVRVRPDPVMTFGPEVADLNARAGFAPDPQQELALDLIFAIRPDGSPDSFAGCVICCRQNLKTGLFKQTALGWIFVTEEPTVVWSAHEMITTTDAQRDLENLITGNSFLSKHLAPGVTNGIFYGSLGQRIEFASGQQILFKARTNTGGRGLARRKLILDEAFALTPAMMGSIVPVLMAQEHAQMLYGSSAGKADSDVLRDVRDRGRGGKSPRLWYLEWLSPKEPCADSGCTHPKDALDRGIDCALDREHLLIKANPATSTGRITIERLRDVRQELPPEEYMRECLGWWDDPEGASVFGAGKWDFCAGPEFVGKFGCLVVATAVDQSNTCVAGVGMDGERYAGKPLEYGPGQSWAVASLVALYRLNRVPVVVDSRGPAAALVPHLEAAGVPVKALSTVEVLDAHANLFQLVQDGKFTHGRYPELEAAVGGATTRAVGDRWAWGRRKSAADISPLEAVTLGVGFLYRPQSVPQIHAWPDDDDDDDAEVQW